VGSRTPNSECYRSGGVAVAVRPAVDAQATTGALDLVTALDVVASVAMARVQICSNHDQSIPAEQTEDLLGVNEWQEGQ
jgi:hypothetical protein